MKTPVRRRAEDLFENLWDPMLVSGDERLKDAMRNFALRFFVNGYDKGRAEADHYSSVDLLSTYGD